MRSTKGKTWEEIYGPEYAEVKRQKLREHSCRSKSPETRARISATKKQRWAEGRYVAHQKGRPLSDEQKRKISATRRARYGTRSSLNKRVRFTSKYRQWRTEIFVRDDYTCQHCGASTRKMRKRVYLHVHHIVELWRLLEGLTFEEAMDDPGVWDSANAETLCISCHKQVPVGAYWE